MPSTGTGPSRCSICCCRDRRAPISECGWSGILGARFADGAQREVVAMTSGPKPSVVARVLRQSRYPLIAFVLDDLIILGANEAACDLLGWGANSNQNDHSAPLCQIMQSFSQSGYRSTIRAAATPVRKRIKTPELRMSAMQRPLFTRECLSAHHLLGDFHRWNRARNSSCTSGLRSSGVRLPVSLMMVRIWSMYSVQCVQCRRWASNRWRSRAERASSR